MKKLFLKNFLLLLLLQFTYFETLSGKTNRWTSIPITDKGKYLYVDFENVRYNGGFIYFWWLTDFSDPEESGGYSSISVYSQVECNEFKSKNLQYNFYNGPMGTDFMETSPPLENYGTWKYPSPGSIQYNILKIICMKK
tara:strand:- start:127 stop:543 length:417 start_codon:yes stop_codon:yes gene_type:complete